MRERVLGRELAITGDSFPLYTQPETIIPEISTKFIMPLHMYHKMLCYARASRGEIGGFFKTRVLTHRRQENKEIIKEYHVHIEEVKIFEQVVTPAHNRITAESLTKFYLDLVKKKENPKKWNGWWHSHNDFSTFFSGEDEDTISKLSKNGDLYSICINKMGELSARYDKNSIMIEEVNVKIEEKINASLQRACRKEVERKIKYRSYSLDEQLEDNAEIKENTPTKKDEFHTPIGYPRFYDGWE